jgi:hypothetical protein
MRRFSSGSTAGFTGAVAAEVGAAEDAGLA